MATIKLDPPPLEQGLLDEVMNVIGMAKILALVHGDPYTTVDHLAQALRMHEEMNP
jgi:hypothetical protein